MDAHLFHAGGGRAGAAVKLADVAVREAVLFHKRHRLCKVFIRLTRKACAKIYTVS